MNRILIALFWFSFQAHCSQKYLQNWEFLKAHCEDQLASHFMISLYCSKSTFPIVFKKKKDSSTHTFSPDHSSWCPFGCLKGIKPNRCQNSSYLFLPLKIVTLFQYFLVWGRVLTIHPVIKFIPTHCYIEVLPQILLIFISLTYTTCYVSSSLLSTLKSELVLSVSWTTYCHLLLPSSNPVSKVWADGSYRIHHPLKFFILLTNTSMASHCS